MKLANYYQLQRVLDSKINEKFNLEPMETIFHKLLALVVEIGEASNEHRGFKFWSVDRSPRILVPLKPTMNYEDIEWRNPLLEEFVDALHFGISIGNDLKIQLDEVKPRLFSDVSKGTLQTLSWVHSLAQGVDMDYNQSILKKRYTNMMEYLLGLGMAYGFDEDNIEAAYILKNQENHKRQLSGY